ncbi:hypothetical protein GGI07_003525 [Coemansia sp. Benny D115]|nr:hypothetical protein GGI07_003525 [Coemansia sp. Benny D115]
MHGNTSPPHAQPTTAPASAPQAQSPSRISPPPPPQHQPLSIPQLIPLPQLISLPLLPTPATSDDAVARPVAHGARPIRPGLRRNLHGMADDADRTQSQSAPTTPYISRMPSGQQQQQPLPLQQMPVAMATPTQHLQKARTDGVAPLSAVYARHQRRVSVQDAATPQSLPSAQDRAWRSQGSRRGSVAASVNLSITHGVPLDLDRIDMDDDDDSDDSAGASRSASMADSSTGPTDTNTVPRSPAVPRNKAFLRLLSLVDEDRRAQAAEIEHESHITRSIRHSSVQEWLRCSADSLQALPARPPSPASSALSSPHLATVPRTTTPKRKADDDEASGDAHPPLKRLAMSPSGLRPHFAVPARRKLALPPAPRSGPSSPLLPAAATTPGATRARSNTALLPSTHPAPSVMQANGVFSRMNLSDTAMDDSPG